MGLVIPMGHLLPIGAGHGCQGLLSRRRRAWCTASSGCFVLAVPAPGGDVVHPPLAPLPGCRPEMVVGWYHSHPGFGCWLSGVDVNTQQSFEALNARAVAVVIDPIQSVKGKVVIDAFRCISPQTMMLGQEARQTTSNVGHLNKPSIQARVGREGCSQGWGKEWASRLAESMGCLITSRWRWAEQDSREQ